MPSFEYFASCDCENKPVNCLTSAVTMNSVRNLKNNKQKKLVNLNFRHMKKQIATIDTVYN